MGEGTRERLGELVNARPDDQPYDGYVPAEEVRDDVPPWHSGPGEDSGAVRDHEPAASTWVPPESPETGARPAWLPPGAHPGQPYGPPPGEAYGAPPPGWPPPYGGQPPYGGPSSPYGGPPPYGQLSYGQPPYGAQPGHRKPRMPRWAKIVLVVGVVFYGLSAIWQIFNMLVLSR